MKNKFYIMTALVISLTGCSNIEDGTQPTGNFPEDHIIRIDRSECACVACRI